MSDFRGVVPLRDGPFRVILRDRFLRELGGHLAREDGPTRFSFKGARRVGEDGLGELEAGELVVGYLDPREQPDGWLTLGGDWEKVSRDAGIVASWTNPVVLGGAETPRLVMAADRVGLDQGVVRLRVAPAAPPCEPVVWEVPVPAPRLLGWAGASAAALLAALLVRLLQGPIPSDPDPVSLLVVALAGFATLLVLLQLRRPRQGRAGRRSAQSALSLSAASSVVEAPLHSRPPGQFTPNVEASTPGGGAGELPSGPVGAPRVFFTAGASRWRMKGRPWSDGGSASAGKLPLLRLLWTRPAVEQLLEQLRKAGLERDREGELESAGVLLGKLGWDERGRRTGLVQRVDPLQEATSGPFHVAIPAASLDQYREVGWDVLALYHTHIPESGIGVAPSQEDLDSFRIIADEGQAMVILDTDRGGLGVYTWGVDGQGLCLLQAPELAILDWPEGRPSPFSNYRVSAPVEAAEGVDGPPDGAGQLVREMVELGRRAALLQERRQGGPGERSDG